MTYRKDSFGPDPRRRNSDKGGAGFGRGRPGQAHRTGPARPPVGAGPLPPPLPRAPRPEQATPPAELPPDVPVVHLRSASYGSFIYQRMMGDVTGPAPADGDIVAVVDRQGKFFGWGFYNSQSQIALRMFSHSPQRPEESFIDQRLARAVQLRRDLLRLDEVTDAYRLVHAEGDGLSGLIADRFGQYVVFEIFSLAMFARLNRIQDALIDAGLSVRNFIVRADRKIAQAEGFRLGTLEGNKDRDSVVITEHGVKFKVLLSRGHKTGFFCDQRDNRQSLTVLTPGKSVLDLCCYTGGFACYAAARGQAKSVTAVDLDENALALAVENAALNSASIDFHHDDAFDFLRAAANGSRQWEVVVSDPSKFVSRREDMQAGLRKYFDLNRLAMAAVAPGGVLVTCSCSGLVDQPTFVQTVARAARAAGRNVQILRVNGAGPDHPVMADTPESAYLKVVWCRVE